MFNPSSIALSQGNPTYRVLKRPVDNLKEKKVIL